MLVVSLVTYGVRVRRDCCLRHAGNAWVSHEGSMCRPSVDLDERRELHNHGCLRYSTTQSY